MQVMLMGLMSKMEYLIMPKGTKFTGLGKLGLSSLGAKVELTIQDQKSESCFFNSQGSQK